MDHARGAIVTVLHKTLFSFNLAFFAVAWDASRANPSLIGRVAPLDEFLLQPMAGLLGTSILRERTLFDFIATWCLLAVLFYACTYLVGKISRSRAILTFAPPLVAAEAMPLYWIFLGSLVARFGRGINWVLAWEIAFVLGFIVLYGWREWPPNRALRLVLFVFHFGLWGWLTWYPPGFWLWLIYPLLGLSSVVTWELYLASVRGERKSAETV
jgi:hypothetical protein